jgi:hypothetical protein
MRNKILALEDFDEEVVVAAPIEADTEEAQSFQEAEDHEAQMAESFDGAADAIRVIDTFDTMRSTLDGEERISPPAARALEVAVEHFLVRLGAPKRLTHVAMEDNEARAAGLGEKIKSIITAVINAIKKAMEHLANFFRSVFNGSKKLQMRANALKAHIKKTPPGNKTGDVIGMLNEKGLPGWVYMLTVDGTFPDERTFLSHLKQMETSKVLNANYASIASEANHAFSALFKSVKAGEGASQDARDTMSRLFVRLEVEETLPLGDAVYSAAGGKVSENKAVTVSDTFKAVSVTITKKKEMRSTVLNEVDKLSDGGIELTANLVLEGLAKFDKAEREVGEIEALFKKILNDANVAINGIHTTKTTDASIARMIAGTIMELKSTLMKGASVLATYKIKTYKAALDYAVASAKTSAA